MTTDQRPPSEPPSTSLAVLALCVVAIGCVVAASRKPKAIAPTPPPSLATVRGERVVPTRADTLSIDAVAFPKPRAVLIQLKGVAPAGTQLELVSGFQTIARTPIFGDRPRVSLEDVPDGSEFRLAIVTPDLDRIPGRGVLQMPGVFPLSELAVLASEATALVDFRVSCPEPFTVEVKPAAGGAGGATARGEPGSRRFRHAFRGLAADTGYRLAVTFEGVWGKLNGHRFRTRPASFAQARARALAAGPAGVLAFASSAPVDEVTTAVLAVATGPAVRDRSLLVGLADAAAALRSPELARPLVPHVGEDTGVPTRTRLLEALALCGHDMTRELSNRHLDAVADPDELVHAARAVALGGGVRAAERIGGAAAREDVHVRLRDFLCLMVEADRLTARLWLWDWVKSSRADLVKLKGPALAALGEMGETRDVPSIVRLLFATDAALRDHAADAIASTRSREARTAIQQALVALPERPDVWRAAARLGLPEAIPVLEKRLAANPTAESKRTLAWALAVMKHTAAAPALRGLLADKDPQVVASAAWALGELEDRGAVGALTVLALSERDAGGLAAHALARLEHAGAAPGLAALLAKLAADPKTPPERLGLVAHALARLTGAAPPPQLAALSADATRPAFVAASIAAARRADAWLVPAGAPFVPTGLALARGDSVTLSVLGAGRAAARVGFVHHGFATEPHIAIAPHGGPVELLPSGDGPPAPAWITVSH